MCVALCSRRRLLFWTHDDCSAHFCPVVGEQHGLCPTCRHRQADQTCALTCAPLPETGGCCHWNITPVAEPVRVTPAMVAPLAGYFERVSTVLAGIPHQFADDEWRLASTYGPLLADLGVEYRLDHNELWIDPEQLILVIEEPVTDILDRLDTSYQAGGDSVWIDPDELGLPLVFGQGTDNV